jgi:hypothetical protein
MIKKRLIERAIFFSLKITLANKNPWSQILSLSPVISYYVNKNTNIQMVVEMQHTTDNWSPRKIILISEDS